MRKLLLLGAFLAGCHVAGDRPLPTVPQVDLRRYAGKWYEIARLPNTFQRANESATAEYTPAPDGSVIVLNTAHRPDGTVRTISGRATAVPGSGNARLRVKFSGLASLVPVSDQGNYWIIGLDEERYRNALVGTPDRHYLWLLSRTPQLEEATVARLLAQAKALGFPTETILRDPKGLDLSR